MIGKRLVETIIILSSDEDEAESPPTVRGVKRLRSDSPLILTSTLRRPAPVMTRQEMERDRLQRHAAAASSSSSSYSAPTAKIIPSFNRADKFKSFGDLPVNAEASGSGSSAKSSGTTSANTNVNANVRTTSTRYWKGEIKMTANRFHPASRNDTLTITDIIGPQELLVSGIVSAMQLNPTFVLDHFPSNVPLLLVTRDDRARTALPANVTTVVPDMAPVGYGSGGCFHTKIFILYYKDFVRICITSANAESYDYEIIENAIFIQDFPISSTSKAIHTAFSRPLAALLSTLHVPTTFRAPFELYDYSASKDSVRLVATYQGEHVGWDKIKEGCGFENLARGVSELQLSKGGRYEFEVQGSSIGALSKPWLGQMLSALRGIAPSSYYKKKQTTPPSLSLVNLPLKLIFPTLAEIDESSAGRGGGGTVFCQPTTWTKYTAEVKSFFHRATSKRPGVVSHAKYLVAIHKPINRNAIPVGFKWDGVLYVGSHNFSGSAWSTLAHNAGGEVKAISRNWELGVVVKFEGATEQEQEQKLSSLVGYQRPLVRYSTADVPWTSDLHLGHS